MIAIIFSLLSVLAIVAGGLVSAFSAGKPSRSTAWVSAYLALVVGIIQLGLINAWQRLGQPEDTVVLLALIIYNLGNLSVVIGTLKTKLKYYRVLVNLGGLSIALAMILLLFAVKSSKISWTLVELIILVAIILISTPIGLRLSSNRHEKEVKHEPKH